MKFGMFIKELRNLQGGIRFLELNNCSSKSMIQGQGKPNTNSELITKRVICKKQSRLKENR